MDVRPQELEPREMYRLLVTSVVPQPITPVLTANDFT